MAAPRRYTDNEAWTEGMGFEVAAPWHPWTFESQDGGSGQVAGYATRYANANNFTFITVKGGRHEVPETASGTTVRMSRPREGLGRARACKLCRPAVSK